MATLSLKVSVVDKNVIKTMQFDPPTMIYDACRIIREKISEANLGQPKDYGLFLADEDPKKGVWLEQGRSLEFYLLRNGDLLEYKRKMRTLRVRMLDGSVKTMMVDDSQQVANLMVVICTKIGITNHDEYSLVRDLPEEEKDHTGTLTLRRKDKDKDKDQDKKMEQLKKKLRTDDEMNWVDHSKTLREQGIDESETLLLRRKYFFSDQNIDSRDPVQLNLLYVQARDAILDGTHPVTLEKSCEFAGFQCQIQFGDHIESKHKAGFLDLKEFLSKENCKIKGVEKRVFAEHKKASGLSELDAKVKYTALARSLKTYGVTFFLVKEKMKGKNKLVPRLLGVTKESVLRLDEKTKEILKTWPLTTVRRWAASPNTFTLDFGDYSDQYYSVQTTEGEQISQLIAGYIDIILKKKKAKDHFGIEGDEGSTMVEESVSPAKATILQHQSSKIGRASTGSVALPVVMRAGANGAKPYTTGHMEGAQYGSLKGQALNAYIPPLSPTLTAQQPRLSSVMSEPQRGLLGVIDSGQKAIQIAEHDLHVKAQFPEIGTDPASLKWKQNTLDLSRQNVSSQLAAMNAATAQVVTLTSGPPDDVDHAAVGAAINTITTNLPDITRDVKIIAALMDDDLTGERLLDATRKLCNAFSDLLKAAEPEKLESRQTLLNAASRVGEASGAVLATIGEEDGLDKETQDILLALAKAVANTTAALVLKAKTIASKCEDQATQNKVISSATQVALATSQLVACTKVVAPTISSPACQQQLIEAAKEVARAVEGIVAVCQNVCKDDHLMKELSAAATQVTQALDGLLNHIRYGLRAQETVHDGPVDTILVATDKLFSSSGDANEMVRQAKILAQATAQLIHAIKGQAEAQPDSDLQKRLLAAAKMLADATSRMVEAAKACASNPHDSEQQALLRKAAEDLRNATNVAASNALKKKVISKLESAAKHAAATATQTLSAAQGANQHNTNPITRSELTSTCKDVVDVIPRVVHGVKGTLANPDSPSAQLALINACQDLLPPSTQLITVSKSALPTITDQASSMQLNNVTKQMSTAITELRSALGKAQEACGNLETDSALDMIQALDAELEAFRKACEAFQLRPLPGETSETSAMRLGTSSKAVGSSIAQLLTAVSQGNENYAGLAARDTAGALRNLTDAVRGVAATSTDRDIPLRVIDIARDVLDRSCHLILEARRTAANPGNPEQQQKLSQVAKGVSQALNNCVNCLPGQRDVDEAIKTITDASHALNTGHFPDSNKPYGELQSNLNNAAANLNEAASDVVISSRGTPVQLASSSKRFGNAFGDLMGSGMEMAGQTKDVEVKSQMVVSLKNVSIVSSKLLVAAKSVAADPNAPNARNQLSAAARAVTESINHLVNVFTSAAPGQKECDNAIRNIQMMRPLLDNPSEPINDCTYFECLDTVMEKSKSLGDGMTGIANHAKKSEHEQFGNAVKGVSDSICGLIEASAQAAYLIGVSDPSSVAGRAGLVDQSQFARASQAIQMACQNLTNPASNQQLVLSAATVIAKHTSLLCNSCRMASSKTSNPVAKRHFVQSAKDVANATASLVKEIKTLDSDYNDANRQNCARATKSLIAAVDTLCTFASSPEFASIPAKISFKARSSQEPITSAGKAIIDGSCNMILSAKSLAVNPKDPPTWQSLASHSKNVSDSIKKLVSSIRDKAPGQKECDDAIERLSTCIRDLDQTALSAINQSLEHRRDNTLKGFNEQMENTASEIRDKIPAVRTAAKAEAEKLGHAVSQMVSYFDPLVSNAIGSASNTLNSKQQVAILDQTKTVAECAQQLVYAAKEGAGNPKSTHVHADIEESADAMADALQDLLQTLETVATEAGVVTGLVESIHKSIVKVDERFVSSMDDSFVDYQTRMVNAAKEIARIAQDMVAKSATNPGELGGHAANLSHNFAKLAEDSRGAVAATPNIDVAGRIRSSVQDLGTSCVDLVKFAGSCQANPGDTFAMRDLTESARIVSERVSYVLAALQAGSRGTQACINAASTVSGIIGDLDTTIMFATAGTLHAENEDETFSDHRENILKTAKALVEDTKTLVAGAASSQEQLAVAAQNAVATIIQLAEVVKFGAASLGSNNPESQVMLINAVKDVASALGDLIQATKSASGKSIHDPAMLYLKDSAKVMVTNVTSLLKTVKAVEDEHTRGTRALESTIEAIGQEIRAYDSVDTVITKKATHEDLIRCTKPITLATAKAAAAGNSGKQDDVIVAANMGRKAIFDLLTTCKSSSYTAETEEVRYKVLQSGRECAYYFREMLTTVHSVIQRSTTEGKQQLNTTSRKIASCVSEIENASELLRASSRWTQPNQSYYDWGYGYFGTDWMDPDDPTVVAENELLGAASAIDAAAKRLSHLKPRKSVTEGEENMQFDEVILDSCKSIASATSALVKAASSAQRELVAAGKISGRPLYTSDDGQWSEGLISAARLVAAATHSLCEAANAFVQGHATEEKLISSAKQVAGSTAHLLVACKVKADPDSNAMKRLQTAGNAVKRATDNLVHAAQQAIERDEERQIIINKRLVYGMAQEITAREEVLRIERELEEARIRLATIRRAKYKDRPEDDSYYGYDSS